MGTRQYMLKSRQHLRFHGSYDQALRPTSQPSIPDRRVWIGITFGSPTMTHYSDIVSDISSGSIYIFLYKYILTFYLTFFLASILAPSIWHLFWHSFWHVFGSRPGPLHPEIAISDPLLPTWRDGGEKKERSKEGRKEGVAPLSKSRDPHLKGRENHESCCLIRLISQCFF